MLQGFALFSKMENLSVRKDLISRYPKHCTKMVNRRIVINIPMLDENGDKIIWNILKETEKRWNLMTDEEKEYYYPSKDVPSLRSLISK